MTTKSKAVEAYVFNCLKDRRDRIYRLKKSKTSGDTVFKSRHSRSKPLLWYDPVMGMQRALRYASNQKSPFVDEQDDNAIVTPVIFVDGFLKVPHTSPVLQMFLEIYPDGKNLFEEINTEKDAERDLEKLDLEEEAIEVAKKLTLDQREAIVRIALGKNVEKMSVAEVKLEVKRFARNNPKAFLEVVDDPDIEVQGLAAKFFEERLLTKRNSGRDIFFNLPDNKKKLMTIPHNSDAVKELSAYLMTNDGIELKSMLEKYLDED